ncbi:hypothetical protein ABID26_007091 [Mesorhizobium shonense]|uniref:Uncharacterized protein n=1 Tax=Mesorhizobium shonense TaxID=1209948 RepID=A0ABV2I475_9HYPH
MSGAGVTCSFWQMSQRHLSPHPLLPFLGRFSFPKPDVERNQRS